MNNNWKIDDHQSGKEMAETSCYQEKNKHSATTLWENRYKQLSPIINSLERSFCGVFCWSETTFASLGITTQQNSQKATQIGRRRVWFVWRWTSHMAMWCSTIRIRNCFELTACYQRGRESIVDAHSQQLLLMFFGSLSSSHRPQKATL